MARRSLPYMPGLDGVRAIAVIAVVLYHLDVEWLPGGFLGVDVFFVVSGFLITSLLLAGMRSRGHFDVKEFWLRRARRLLPALILVLIGVVTYVTLALPGELRALRGDVAAAVGYVTNWALIVTDTSYFEAFSRPPLLRHLWSLAVEEQFYVVWPLVFAAGWALLRRRLLFVVWIGAVVSAVVMAVLYEPLTDPSRVYFGTDTRAVGLLVGAGLAFVTTPALLAVAVKGWARTRRELAGWGGLIVLAALTALGSEFDPAMYRGGFLVASVATMAVIVGAASPTTPARILSVPLLVWIGRRSYGIYLWHWPVLMLTRPELDVPYDGLALVAARIGLTVGLAAVSYRWVERPIIEHGFGPWVRSLLRPRPRPARALAGVGGAAAVTALVATLAFAPPSLNTLPEASAADELAVPASPHLTTTSTTSTTTPAQIGAAPTGDYASGRLSSRLPDGDAPATTTTAGAPATTSVVDRQEDVASVADPPATAPTAAPPVSAAPRVDPAPAPESEATPVEAVTVTAIGDSVMLGAAPVLAAALGETATIDALVSRSFADGAAVAAGLAAEGRLGDVVVIHLGTNGPIDDHLVDELMAATEDADRVLAITVRVPRRWETQVNETLRVGAARWQKLELVDWYGASDGRQKLFVDDGVHLTANGKDVYADLVAQAVSPVPGCAATDGCPQPPAS